MSPDTPARTLIPLFTHPAEDPSGWAAAAARGIAAAVVLKLPTRRTPVASTEVVATTWSGGVRQLGEAGARSLGHVSLGYGVRPVPEVLADVNRWANLDVNGVFFDHAPSRPRQFDQALRAVRSAHHNGLDHVVLNPGGPVDPVYRRLNATICTFEGTWSDYLTWAGDGAERGDGHLIFGVTAAQRAVARALVAARGAGLYLISEHADAYSTPVAVQSRHPSTTTPLWR